MTFATQITVSRMVLVPVFAGLSLAYANGVRMGVPDESLRILAIVTFVVAAASDGIDGWVARRFNQYSTLGAYLDPIADKALLLSGVILLTLTDWGDGRLPAWFAIMVVLRDAMILIGIKVLSLKRYHVRIAPQWSGKLCTASQMLVIGWAMLKLPVIPVFWLCLGSALFTGWSAVTYFREGRKIIRLGPGPVAA